MVAEMSAPMRAEARASRLEAQIARRGRRFRRRHSFMYDDDSYEVPYRRVDDIEEKKLLFTDN